MPGWCDVSFWRKPAASGLAGKMHLILVDPRCGYELIDASTNSYGLDRINQRDGLDHPCKEANNTLDRTLEGCLHSVYDDGLARRIVHGADVH